MAVGSKVEREEESENRDGLKTIRVIDPTVSGRLPTHAIKP